MKQEHFGRLSGLAQASIRRAIANKRFEATGDGGILLPAENAIARGMFVVSINGGEPEYHRNKVVGEGLDYLLNAGLGGQQQVSQWYIALFAANVTPGDTWTGANFAATATEFTDYDESERPAFTPGAATGGVQDNFDNEAQFTVNANNTIYGGAIISSSAKSDTTGILLAAALFQGGQRDVQPTDVINVGYQLVLTSAT